MKMEKLLAGLLILLMSAAAFAEETPGGDKAKKSEADAAVKNGEAETVFTEQQFLLLKEKVRKLEDAIESSRSSAATPAPNAVKAAETPTAAGSNSAAAAPTAEQMKKMDALYKAFGQLNVSGDLRMRYEGLFDQGFDNIADSPDRNRLRMRARLQIAGQLNKNFDWALRLSTGSLTDPTSTNQTSGDFFNRKPIGLDRYFIRYDSKSKPVGITLQGGKFDYPWKRTELTFDNDLQPEGAAETVYYKGEGRLKEAKLTAFQLVFNETSAGKDSYLLGGQLLGKFSTGDWTFTGSAAFLNFNRADAIARALGRPSTQVGGGLESGTTNRVRRDAAGNAIGFAANFNILDLIGEATYSGFKKYPVTVLFNYARNMSGRLDKLGERNAYWAEVKVGRLKERGDIEFGYTFIRVEQDAVLSPFNYSDILQTNSSNSRFSFGYALDSNINIQFTGLLSSRSNALPNRESRLLKRFQVDVNYRF